MNWFAQRQSLKLAAVLAALLGAVVAYVSLQPDELTRYKAQLAARGEKLSLLELSPPFSEKAVEYYQHFNNLVARLPMSPIDISQIKVVEMNTSSVARVAWDQPAPSIGSNTWAELDWQFKASEPDLSKLRGLLATAPSGTVFTHTNPYGYKSPIQFQSQRKAAWFLAAAVVNALHHSRLRDALPNLHALLSLASQHDGGGVQIDHMVHASIANFAALITWESLQSSGWTEPQLASIQSAWQSFDLVRGFDRTVEMERAFALVCFEVFRTNATECRQMFGSGGQSIASRVYQNAYLTVWARSWSRGDEIRFLEVMQPMVSDVRQAVASGNYYSMRASFGETITNIFWRRTAFEKYRFPMTAMIVPNWQSSGNRLLHYETQRQMCLAAIALKRHELKHGKLPANLAALIPDLLSSQPIDHLSGRPLTYQRLSDHRFTLRSVGDNEHDDGGAADNLVWPEPELSTDSPRASRQ